MSMRHHVFRDKSLQKIYNSYLDKPPRKSGSSVYQAFWNGYYGRDIKISRIMRGSANSAAYLAGRDYRRNKNF